MQVLLSLVPTTWKTMNSMLVYACASACLAKRWKLLKSDTSSAKSSINSTLMLKLARNHSLSQTVWLCIAIPMGGCNLTVDLCSGDVIKQRQVGESLHPKMCSHFWQPCLKVHDLTYIKMMARKVKIDSQLTSLHLCSRNVIGDGNFLFRAIGYAAYGEEDKHDKIQASAANYILNNKSLCIANLHWTTNSSKSWL